MITVASKGDYSKLSRYLNQLEKAARMDILEKYGKEGVAVLSAATPVKTGLTANSWTYEVKHGKGSSSIAFSNTNVNKGVPIAIILQYGHGTRNGGYVQGRDYINPAIHPIFDKLVDELWREVTKA